MPLHYSLSEFEALYESIQAQDSRQVEALVEELQDDLRHLNSTVPAKNDGSRAKLESGKVTLSSGAELAVNNDFVVAAVQVSDDLNLDECISAEFVYQASSSHSLGTSVVDAAKAAFYLRRQNILSIVSYLFHASSSTTTTGNGRDVAGHVTKIANVDALFQSVAAVEAQLVDIDNLVKRARLLGMANSIYFQQEVKFRRDFLYREHELLGEILHGYVASHRLNPGQFTAAFRNLDRYDPDDYFTVHWLAGLLRYVSQLAELSDGDVSQLYDTLVRKELADVDGISGKPIKLAVVLVFLTYFTKWCNDVPARSREFEFESSCSQPMAAAIELGAMEQLMCVAADAAALGQHAGAASPFYDLRSLLQSYLPKLIPKRVWDVDEDRTAVERRRGTAGAGAASADDVAPVAYVQTAELQTSDHFASLLVPVLASFVETFIETAAFVLTKLRDSEEDSLLSSEKSDLAELGKRAELERFYLTVFYVYGSRPALAARFWEKSSPLYGFVRWASSSNSALMRSSFCVMLSALACGDRNAIETYNFLQSNLATPTASASVFVIRNTTSSISWSVIYEDLVQYNRALAEPADRVAPHAAHAGPGAGPGAGSGASATTASATVSAPPPQLAEDSVAIISGYFQLITQVAANNVQTRRELFESDDMELPNILKSFLANDTALGGECLATLRALVSDAPEVCNKIWHVLEGWIFQPAKARPHISKDGARIGTRKVFAQSLKSFDDVVGFVHLLHDLLAPPVDRGTETYRPFALTFPTALGADAGRKHGIYPYLEFAAEEVFASSTQPFLDHAQRAALQAPLLSLFVHCLDSLDDKSLSEYAKHCHLAKFDNLFEGSLDFQTFVQGEPSSAVMNYLFSEPAYTALFDIISVGTDAIADKPAHAPAIRNLELALSVVRRVLSLQAFFVETAVPMVKHPQNPFYAPADFGTHGLRSFYDALLFKLPVVAHLALYVGSQHTVVAQTAAELLATVAASPRFSGGVLLTTFETIDESDRIKSAFIDQMAAAVSDDASLTVKLKILKFLDTHLSSSRRDPTVAHFLLGFQLRGDTHLAKGNVDSDRSLFKTLQFVLLSSLDGMYSQGTLLHAPAKLAAATMAILLKLCRNPLTSGFVMPLLRDASAGNLFVKLLSADTNGLEASTASFEGYKFDGVLGNQNRFTTLSQGIGALISFVQFRRSVAHYLAIEFSKVSAAGPLSLKDSYVNVLMNGDRILNGASKVLGFLDVLEFNFTQIVQPFDMSRFGEFDYDFLLKHIGLKDYDLMNTDTPIYDLSCLDKMVELNSVEALATSVLPSPEARRQVLDQIHHEHANIRNYLINYSAYNDFKAAQLGALKAWTLLIQVLISAGRLDDALKSRIVLEVFQTLIPKINDYIDSDISFAGHLVSLCVLVYDQFDDTGSADHVLYPIFQTCIYGLNSSHSTPDLRSDFYILANKYLKAVASDADAVRDVLKSLDLAQNDNLLKIVFGDSIMGDSPARVTSLLFLETLVKLSVQYDRSVFGGLTRNDYLSFLVRSIKRTDELLTSCFDTCSVSLYGLLYELTAFKATMYFLIRVAETRSGAHKLIQADVFNTINSCSILKIDPDLGVNLKFDELNDPDNRGATGVVTNLSLDTPLRLPSEYHAGDKQAQVAVTTISLFEIFVPIFQLVSGITISMGPANDPIRAKNRDLLAKVGKLVVGTLKRDAILEEKRGVVEKESSNVYHNDVSLAGLKELVKQFTLLYSLIE